MILLKEFGDAGVLDAVRRGSYYSDLYRHMYDYDGDFHPEDYDEYCRTIVSLDVIFNVPNLLKAVDNSSLLYLTVSDLLAYARFRGIIMLPSARTRDKCLQVAAQFGDHRLTEEINRDYDLVLARLDGKSSENRP